MSKTYRRNNDDHDRPITNTAPPMVFSTEQPMFNFKADAQQRYARRKGGQRVCKSQIKW